MTTALPPTNHAGQTVELTGPATLSGGNWCGLRVDGAPPPSFALRG